MSDEAAVFVADMLPTGYSAVRRADLSLGDVVAVVGCGTVGQMAIIFAKRVARTVIAVDGIPARRALAERFGAHRRRARGCAAAVIAEATGGLGADGVIEAAGSAGALTAAITFARGQGTVSVVGAHFEPDYPLNNGLMFERELTLRVTWGHPFNDRDRILAFMATGEIDPTPADHPSVCPGGRRGGVPSVRCPRGGEGAAHAVGRTRRSGCRPQGHVRRRTGRCPRGRDQRGHVLVDALPVSSRRRARSCDTVTT